MKKHLLTEEYLGYDTAQDPTKIDARHIVAGSKNVIVNRNRKVQTRGGYTRLGTSNTALTGIRSAWTWHTSTGTSLPIRMYDDELEVYLGTSQLASPSQR